MKPVVSSTQSNNDYQYMAGVCSYSLGGTVAVGNLHGAATATFGSGEANQTTLTDPNQNGSVFLARYGTDGSLVWAKIIQNINSEAPPSVAALADGTIFATGFLTGTTTFGPGEPNQTIVSTSTGAFFLARYAGTGSLLWAKAFPATNTGDPNQVPGATAWTISAVGSDSVVVGGNFLGKLDCGGTTLTNNTTNQGTYFLAKYRSDGSLVWAKQGTLTGPGSDAIVVSVRAFSDKTMSATGWIAQTVTFGPGEPNATTIATGQNYESIFLARFQADGTLAWVRSPNSTQAAKGLGVAAVDDGSAIVCGTVPGPTGGTASPLMRGTVTFGAGEPNQTTLSGSITASPGGFFVARYHADGTLAWAKTAPESHYAYASAVAAFSDGSSIVVGGCTGQCVFGSGEPNQTTVSVGDFEDTPFIARYNADGTLAWVRDVTGNNRNYANAVVLADGLVVVNGWLSATRTTFGAGEPGVTSVNGNQTTGSSGPYTAYIAAYSPTPH